MRLVIASMLLLATAAGSAAALPNCAPTLGAQVCIFSGGTYNEQSASFDDARVAQATVRHTSIDGFAGHSEGLTVAAGTGSESPAGANGAGLSYYCLDFNGPGAECDFLAIEAGAALADGPRQTARYQRDFVQDGELCLEGDAAQACQPLPLPFL